MMDTPGFSSLYIEDLEPEALKDFFPEFEAYEDECRFLGCVHIGERECGVKTAVQEHKIGQSRYDNYRLMYQELKEKKNTAEAAVEDIIQKWEERTMIILSPSILGADFTKLGEQVAEVDKAGAQYIHLDVMDGAFVPSISFGMPVIKSLRPVTDRVFDVHMMVEEPGRYVEDIKKAGADLICVHQEACLHLDRTIAQIREAGLQTGVALNPATPVETLDVILPEVDMVLLMTVNPGFGGQKFIPYTVEKIKKLRAMCSERGLSTRIEVDGGITPDNVRTVLEAGADVIVAGSAVFKGNPAGNVKTFLNIFQEFEQG